MLVVGRWLWVDGVGVHAGCLLDLSSTASGFTWGGFRYPGFRMFGSGYLTKLLEAVAQNAKEGNCYPTVGKAVTPITSSSP